ncbi:MAG: DNA polymerase Y family protein [Niabella sp.]|nr:DNA polymerase Y family protein [Niabella sp.]
MARFLSIWFPFLVTNSMVRLRPSLQQQPFVLTVPQRGRKVIEHASPTAIKKGIRRGMVVADARALLPELQLFNSKPGLETKLLTQLAHWCIRFTPVVAIDLPEGLLLDTSGCAHLWSGEAAYLQTIITKLKAAGYTAHGAIADTIGAAWAMARYGQEQQVVPPAAHWQDLLSLPPAALRLEAEVLERMKKLGFCKIGQLDAIPHSVLRRRFGQQLLHRMQQAAGHTEEWIEPVIPPAPFRVSLPSLEPIRTATGIALALEQLLDALCLRLAKEEKGLRTALFKGYRIDGGLQQVSIGTNRPVRNKAHLLKLFEQKLDTIAPELGIELFVLEAPVVEAFPAQQEALWKTLGGNEGIELTNLLDRITGHLGTACIRRYLPAAHYWPERAQYPATFLTEKTTISWKTDHPRPVQLLPLPEPISVAAPIPDYPPMLFRYKNEVHNIQKADGPERIEQEWWLEQGQVRDYYIVEDEKGARYWLFRLGRYEEGKPQWYLHGFFA